MSRIVLVEDDEVISELLSLNLEAAGHHVLTAGDGVSGLHLARTGAPDVVLLDLMLPGMDGIEVCRRLRHSGTTPVIVVTAREGEDAAAAILEAGADACITKPFAMREVLARISAVLRRVEMSASERGRLPERDAFGNFVIDRAAWRVTLDGREVHLAPREFELLSFLVGFSGCIHSRDRLIENVWGRDFHGDRKTVDVHIRWLREKFVGQAPFEIATVRGAGYRLDRVAVRTMAHVGSR